MRKVEQSEVADARLIWKKRGEKEILKSRAQQLSTRRETPHYSDRASKEIERAPPSYIAFLPLLGHMEHYLNKQ